MSEVGCLFGCFATFLFDCVSKPLLWVNKFVACKYTMELLLKTLIWQSLCVTNCEITYITFGK